MSTSGPTITELPENKEGTTEKQTPVDDEDLDDELDETLIERLIGLSEMFPERVRNFTCNFASFSVGGTKSLYSGCRSLLWVLTSSACILALPVMFESERAAMEEQQLQQQRQILLGPNAAVSGGAGSGMMPGLAPPMQPGAR